MEKFEETIREIFHLIAEYGVKNTALDYTNPRSWSEKDKKDFSALVHKGFQLGQNKIVEEIIPLFKNKAELKKIEKTAKTEKNKELLEEIGFAKGHLEYRIKILRHFADFIAWQFFKNDYYKARRFYSGGNSRPDLLNSNFESIISAVNHFHKEDETSFALISDLTSFIDIGDILLAKEGGIFVVECKSGEVQGKVFDFIDELMEDNFDPAKIDYTDKNKNFFDQTERTIKQFEKGRKLINFLKTEKGTDPFSKMEISVLESTSPSQYYFNDMLALIEKSKDKKSVYGEIEDVIYIGIYKSEKSLIASSLFKEIIENIPKYKKCIILNYMEILKIPLKEPLFFKPFGVETIFDLLFGRLTIYLALELDKLIEIFNSKGVKARWLSKKITAQILKSENPYKPFVHENRAIEITVNDQKITLGDSFVIYLLLDNLTPSSLVERYNSIKKEE